LYGLLRDESGAPVLFLVRWTDEEALNTIAGEFG
jgi:hypothetical protein